MADAAMAMQSRMAIEPGSAPHTFDVDSEFQEFLSEQLRAHETITDTAGLRGTRPHSAERSRITRVQEGGRLVLPVSPLRLDDWLPRILGGVEQVDVFAPDETLPSFGVLLDRVSQTFLYRDCKINRAIFRGQSGGLLELELDVIGASETVGVSFPAIEQDLTPANDPLVFSDGVFSVGGVDREVLSFEITIENFLRSRFANSTTVTNVSPADRRVTCRLRTPFSADELDLYGTLSGGAQTTITFTNGSSSTAFGLPALQVESSSPVVDSRDEIVLELQGTARKLGTAAELTVTNTLA